MPGEDVGANRMSTPLAKGRGIAAAQFCKERRYVSDGSCERPGGAETFGELLA